MGQRDLVRRIRENPRAHCWDKEWSNGSENTPKAGTDEKFRNFVVARDTGSDLGLGTKRTALWRRKRHVTLAHPPDDKSSSSSDSSSSSSSSTQAPSGTPQHVNDQAQAHTNSRSQPQTLMGANVPVVLTSTVFPTPTPKALIRSSTQPSEQPNPRHWTCLHRQSIREVKARRWTLGV